MSITSPANNVKLSVGNPPFSGAAGHAAGDLSAITLNIYEGTGVSGKLVQAVHVTGDGETWSLAALPEELENGTYTAQAEQSDSAGNIGKSKAVSFKIATVLTLDPSVFVLRGGAPVTDATPSFHGTAASGAGAGETVTVTIYGLASGEPVEVESREVTRTHARWSTGAMGSLPDGLYTVQVEQAGEGGVEETFTVDADAPEVTLSTPVSGSSTAGSSQTVGGSAGVAPGDAAQVTARLYGGASASGAALQTVTVPSSGGTWSTTFAGLAAGTYTAEAEQRDDVGNVGSSRPVTFTVTAPPAPAPAPPPAATPLARAAASFEWVPAAPHTGEPVTLVSTSTDADSPITAFAWSLGGNSIFQPGPPVLVTSFATAGVHSVELSVTDADGLSGTVAKRISVTAPVAKLMQPFPVIRIAGTQHAASVKVSLLTVLAPVGATVSVTCRGHGCPSKSENVVASAGASKSRPGTVLVTLRRFERSLPAGRDSRNQGLEPRRDRQVHALHGPPRQAALAALTAV